MAKLTIIELSPDVMVEGSFDAVVRGDGATSAPVTPVSELRPFGEEHNGGVRFELLCKAAGLAARTSRWTAATI